MLENDNEERSPEQQMADNDFADKFYRNIVNMIVMFLVLIILSVVLFKGTPDLIDGVTTYLNKEGEKCQN